MSWYAASAIMYVCFKDGRQDHYPVWENVVLIEAESDAVAEARAEERARADEGDSRGSFRWNDRPAEWVFAGIRKILSVSHQAGEALGHGDEVTYSEFTVADEQALRDLAAGREVSARYVE